MMDNHRESRKRLRPWLERMIENNKCPGLIWENKEERTFRIPWRHFNNKDWDEKDSQVFMEWAKYTGKYHDGDKTEYPVWKTRLRCALKKIPEIKELPEQHHLEDPNPYRVYQFIDLPVMKKFSDFDSEYSASPSSTSFFTNSPAVRDILEESVTPPSQKIYDETFLAPTSNVPTVVYDNCFQYNDLTVKTEDPVYSHHLARESRNWQPKLNGQHYDPDFTCCNHFNIPSDTDFLNQMPSSAENYSDLHNIISSDQTDLPILAHEMSANAERMQHGLDSMKASLPSDLMSVESADLCCPNTNNVMQLNLKYGFPHIFALQRKVAANGCRLYFGAPQLQYTILEEELFGPKTVTQIEMPDASEFTDICDEQKRFICGLLDSMERGLVLTYKDGDIYAQRLCRTRVFVSDGLAESRLLDRKEKNPTKVFDFAAYKTAFEQHKSSKTSVMPKHYFFLTFGQEMKKNSSEPMGRVLIHAQVLHTEAIEYANKFSMSDASHFLVPLVSSCNTTDHILQRFKNMNVNNK